MESKGPEADPNLDVDRTDLDETFEAIEARGDFVDDREELKEAGKAEVVRTCAYRVCLKKDKTYFYCTCGKSEKQPFCDGESHEGTGFKPLKVVPTKQVKYQVFCGCKRNKPRAGPICDGSHINIDW